VKGAAHEEDIRTQRTGEVQGNEAEPLQPVDRLIHVSVQSEAEDRVAVELDCYLPDGTKASRVGRGEHLDLGALDVHLHDVDARLVDLRQDRFQPFPGHLDGPVQGAVVHARLGEGEDAATLVVLGKVETDGPVLWSDGVGKHAEGSLRAQPFLEVRIALHEIIPASEPSAHLERKLPTVGAQIDDDRIGPEWQRVEAVSPDRREDRSHPVHCARRSTKTRHAKNTSEASITQDVASATSAARRADVAYHGFRLNWRMPHAIDRPRTPHSFMALFQTNDFRSHCLLRDLEANFGDFQFFIVWDQYDAKAAAEFARYYQLRPIAKEQLFDFVSPNFGVDRDALVKDCRDFPLLLRILLAIYLRRAVGIDYCIMTDNDIFLFESIPEVVGLSATQTPFLIQETGAADTLPEITEYIARYVRKEIRYVQPSKGRGYNAGFCGLDLSVFDAFDRQTFGPLLDTLRHMPQWWREQAFFVNMTFTSSKAVHTFDQDRYLFLPHDDRTYRRKSKIYHCIFTTDKRRVDLYYLRRYGRSVSQWLRAVEICGVLLIQGLRKRLQIRTRIYRLLGRRPVAE
jgi:hypothetical protein